MLQAGVGQSENPHTESAVREAAAKAMSQAGIATADLALVFFTIDHLAGGQQLLAVTRAITRTDRIVGSSAAGVLGGEGEIEGGPGIAVLVMASSSVRAEPLLLHPARARETEMAKGFASGATGLSEPPSLLALFPDPHNAEPRRLLECFEKTLGFLPIVGAGSSESRGQGKTFQLSPDRITDNSVAGFWLNGPFETAIGITQGCQPITEPLVITKADHNVILEIDNRPAFEIFAKVIKGPLLDDIGRALAFVFAGLPADARQNSVAAGHYLVRNIVGLDPGKGMVAVGEEVFEGERMIFTLRDGQRAREDLRQMLDRTAMAVRGRGLRLGLYFNCCARGASLYGIPGIDTAYIRQSLGEFPLIGMFGSFELGPLGGQNHLLAYTGVLVLLSDAEETAG